MDLNNGRQQDKADDAGDTDSQAQQRQQLDPETIEKLAALRSRLQEAFGQIVLSAMTAARYRHLSIADLSSLFLDPLMRERIAIAAPSKDNVPASGALYGVAIWASVSEEVDAKIREQISAGTFPIRLQPKDWNSGEINWLLDVIAPTKPLTLAVIANFRQVIKTGQLRVHPIVTRLVDKETLEKMGARQLVPDP